MDGNLTIFSVGIIVQFRHAFQQFFYDNPMQFDMQYNKFDIFRHSLTLFCIRSRPDIILISFISTHSLLLQTLYRSVRPDIYSSRAEYHLSAPYFVFLHINTADMPDAHRAFWS